MTALSPSSPPQDIVNQLYGGLIQSWLDDGLTVLQTSTGVVAPAGRDPAAEEKVRLILLSAVQLWLFFARDPNVQRVLQNCYVVLADPARWAQVANLIWGTV